MSTATTQSDGQPPPVLLASGGKTVEFPEVGGPVSAGWQEGTLTRAAELEAICECVEQQQTHTEGRVLCGAVRRHLEAARGAAEWGRSRLRRPLLVLHSGPLMERAMSNLDAGEAHLLNLEPAADLLGRMPCLLRHVQCHLRPNDPRRQEFERFARRLGIGEFDQSLPTPTEPNRADQERMVEEERRKIVAVVRAASSAGLREQVRLRSFRNIVVTTTVLLTLLAVGIAITGLIYPQLVPMCFAPEESGRAMVVCPNGQSGPFLPSGGMASGGQGVDDMVRATVRPADLLVIELVGTTAAAIAAAAAIRGLKGSSERYGLPVALVALKLPMGAITAFLGLLLLRGQFVPGLGALDTSAQIVAWALVFGYGQQLFTRLVDQQGQVVLETVRGADKRETGTSSD